MSRLNIPSQDTAPAASAPLLAAVHAQLGVVPNLYRLVGASPAALEGFLGLSGALGKSLDVKTRNRIALVTAQVNGCDYCLSAHSYLGANLAKLDDAEMAANRRGHSTDPKADAAVSFAKKIVELKGKVTDADLAAVKLAGYTDAQIVEIVANVAVNVLTNFVNNVAQTDIDFPVVRATEAA
ncbi:MAG: carboxymuconolactone decarboxylase family protein [Kofleriaceae bacterium]|nr:carboxymuconolactone decarboxylase family protein [Kofleriaceae bacterium]